MDPLNYSTLPFEQSYWVIPGMFLAGEYPGRREDFETRHRIQALLKNGIRVCIDLTKPGEILPSYREILLEELQQYQYEGKYYHFPIYDFGIPEKDQMQRTLDMLGQCIAEKMPVYLHCRAGIGRTGLTVGCFLVRHGLTGDQALEEINRLRKDSPSAWMKSPETDEQVDYIKNWVIGE
jgi:protein-tyrosine phosphatase